MKILRFFFRKRNEKFSKINFKNFNLKKYWWLFLLNEERLRYHVAYYVEHTVNQYLTNFSGKKATKFAPFLFSDCWYNILQPKLGGGGSIQLLYRMWTRDEIQSCIMNINDGISLLYAVAPNVLNCFFPHPLFFLANRTWAIKTEGSVVKCA